MNRRLVALVVSLLSLAAFGSVKELNAQLKRTGARWKAGPSWVSQLAPTERRRLLGAPTPSEDHFFSREKKSSPNRLAAELDWRNKDGVNFVSPMLNQGRCGSCVAFATISTLETQMNITRKTPSSPWAYSPQHLFSCGGGGCETGWTPSSAANFLKETGVPDEACFPYAAGALGEDLACSKTCGNAAERSQKITSWSMPTFLFADTDSVKRALQKGPLLTVMRVYDDFFYYQSGVYHHVSGELAGGHAVAIVGYSEADKAWIVKNSWGEDWGDKGFFKIDWSDVSGVGNQTWALSVPEESGFVTLGSLRDREVLSGAVSIEAQSTFPETESVEVKLQSGSRTVFSSKGKRSIALDTTEFADGVYTATAVANHAGGTATSQPRQIYVLNGALTGKLAFTNVTSGQSVSGSHVFEFTTEASPVPFNRVTFRARNVTTGLEIKRSTPNVASKMALNWRMKDAPNGEYDLTLEGSAGSSASVQSAPVRITVANTSRR